MRSSFAIIGAAALVAANPAPAPQNFDGAQVAAIPVTITRGAPVGVGPAQVTGAYNKAVAVATAEAAVAGATKAAANSKRNIEEKRTLCLFLPMFCKNKTPKPADPPQPGYDTGSGYNVEPTPNKPTMTQAPTAVVTAPSVTPTNVVPSSCTPVDWTNTWAFTSDPACPTAIEVGTYCGFINPLDPCAPQPAAYGPPTTPDTPDAFKKNQVYHDMAQKAKTPTGYQQTFKDLDASVNANSYLAYKILESYDVAGCAAYCDETELCEGFNVYIERDPAWNPDQCSCQDPSSIAQYKCSIFGSGVDKESAVNTGETRNDFEVVIVGSNGYEKKDETPAPPTGWKNPQNCDKKLHDEPKYCLGQHSFPGPFDASLCAAYAAKQNLVNVKAGLISTIINTITAMFGYSPARCVQFQAAEITHNGAAWGTHCRLFTKQFQHQKASLDISVNAEWGCKKSFTFDLQI